MKWYANAMHREVTEQVGIQAHALRYAYACDMLDPHQSEPAARGGRPVRRWTWGTGMGGAGLNSPTRVGTDNLCFH